MRMNGNREESLLSVREYLVLSLRMREKGGRTLEEIAKVFLIPKERVREYEKRAIKKILIATVWSERVGEFVSADVRKQADGLMKRFFK